MTTVLLTGIGGDIAQGLAAILRESRPEWRLLGADIHARHGGSRLLDRLLRAPRVDDPGYDRWLAQAVRDESVSLVVPGSEAELIHLAAQGRTDVAGAPLVMAGAGAIAIGADKLRTAQFLTSIGVPAPWTTPAEDLAESTPFPCVFKARRGAGSKTVFICDAPGDVEYHRRRHPAAVLQELLLPADKEVTCAVFRDRHGRTAVMPLLRTLVGGFTGWAEVIDDPEVIGQCVRVADALGLRGAVNLQLRMTANGPRIFEMNPRFSSTVLMRHRLGFQDFLWSIEDLAGRDVTFPPLPVGAEAVRVQDAAVLAGDRDGI